MMLNSKNYIIILIRVSRTKKPHQDKNLVGFGGEYNYSPNYYRLYIISTLIKQEFRNQIAILYYLKVIWDLTSSIASSNDLSMEKSDNFSGSFTIFSNRWSK